jgi:maltodextrin utilization protein YvdJ
VDTEDLNESIETKSSRIVVLSSDREGWLIAVPEWAMPAHVLHGLSYMMHDVLTIMPRKLIRYTR